MSRILAIIAFGLFLMNCQSTPVGENIEEQEEVSQAKITNLPTTCLTNNQSEDCSLLLETISYSLPEVQCDPYELVVDIETNFFAPAGLEDGTINRIDWEFLPNGNAGFWTASLNQPISPNSSGLISMKGCFSFGEQQTLMITRTIIDQSGNESNSQVIEIEDPYPSKVIAGANSEFEFQSSSIILN